MVTVAGAGGELQAGAADITTVPAQPWYVDTGREPGLARLLTSRGLQPSSDRKVVPLVPDLR